MLNEIIDGKYQLLSKIGSGKITDVYEAVHLLSNRPVAVKILKSNFASDNEFVELFCVEADFAATLSHPNIVAVHEVGRHNGVPYIATEHVEGITLREYLNENGAIPWEEAVNIAIQVCYASEYAFENNIIHGNLKPQNIFIMPDQTVKVSNFGMARNYFDSLVKIVESPMNEVHYFSPEQVRGKPCTEKSDIYALGVMLYEMVTGKTPFSGSDSLNLSLKQLYDEVTPPNEIAPHLPEEINKIIMDAMIKDPELRYQTWPHLLADLSNTVKDQSEELGIVTPVVITEASPNPANSEFRYKAKILNSKGKKLKKPIDSHVMVIDKEVLPDTESNNKPAIPSQEKKVAPEKKVTPERKAVPEKKADMKRLKKIASAVSFLIMGIISFLVLIYIIIPLLAPFFSSGKVFVLSDYTGRNFGEVKTELSRIHIGTIKDVRVFNENVAKDIIIAQNLPKGKHLKIKDNNQIEFTVSDGPDFVSVPNVESLNYKEACQRVIDSMLVPDIEEGYSSKYASGKIYGTMPASGSRVKPGTKVVLYKSLGPNTNFVIIPDLVGKPRGEALTLLAKSNLKAKEIYLSGNSSFFDVVTKQDPLYGFVGLAGDTVNLYLGPSKTVAKTINLPNTGKYGNKVKVLVYYTLLDSSRVDYTPQVHYFINEYKGIGEFPFTFTVPILDNVKTKITVLLDGQVYGEYVEN